jgi:hypothetical protein
MTVVAFNSEVTNGQLKCYADVICFSQVGLDASEISSRLNLPEYLVSAWIKGWRNLDSGISAVRA